MRALLKKGKHLTFVGAHDAFIAKLVENAGFDGVYLSGAGLSNSLGVTDTGVLHLDDFRYAGRYIAGAVSVPVLADADTGFDDVTQTVRAYIETGISGLHIEDQQFPKRCGHLDGKEVVDASEMIAKVRLAAKTRNTLKEDFLLIARTDARGAVNIDEKDQFAEAVRRGKAYIEAGADAIFPESLRSVEEFEKYRAEVPGPLLANMTDFGKTPFITTDEFERLGYQIVIFPVSIFRYLAGCASRAIEIIMKDGNQRNLVDGMMHRKEISRLLDYEIQ